MELLKAKLSDALHIAEKRPHFIGFLDETEVVYAKQYLQASKASNFLLWGGYAEAERKVIGFFPPFLKPDETQLPVSALCFRFRKEDELTHRHFLGTLMALGVERTSVGDILTTEGQCFIMVRSEMRDYFLMNIKKVGRTGVTVEEIDSLQVQVERQFSEMKGVIASDRLDCLVALLAKTSREKAQGLIRMGKVMLNHRETINPAAKVAEGMLISVRKKGRFAVDRLGPLTSKGRLSVICRKYE